jgi:hypothetical protein
MRMTISVIVSSCRTPCINCQYSPAPPSNQMEKNRFETYKEAVRIFVLLTPRVWEYFVQQHCIQVILYNRHHSRNSMEQHHHWKTVVAQTVEKFAPFYGARRFSTVFTRTCHFILSWARWNQSVSSHSYVLGCIRLECRGENLPPRGGG